MAVKNNEAFARLNPTITAKSAFPPRKIAQQRTPNPSSKPNAAAGAAA
jgi:hypothetical protein